MSDTNFDFAIKGHSPSYNLDFDTGYCMSGSSPPAYALLHKKITMIQKTSPEKQGHQERIDGHHLFFAQDLDFKFSNINLNFIKRHETGGAC